MYFIVVYIYSFVKHNEVSVIHSALYKRCFIIISHWRMQDSMLTRCYRVLNDEIFTNKKTRSVCLSGYTFRHALMSHADILDIDRGHIFRKHSHKNNKKVAVI